MMTLEEFTKHADDEKERCPFCASRCVDNSTDEPTWCGASLYIEQHCRECNSQWCVILEIARVALEYDGQKKETVGWDEYLPTDAPPFELDTYTGDDGTPVVHINTSALPEDARGPVCRVYLNDAALFENPAFRGGTEEETPC